MKKLVLVKIEQGVQKKIDFQDILALLQAGKEKTDKTFGIDFFKPMESELIRIAELTKIHHVEDLGNARWTISQFRRRLNPKKEFLQRLVYRDHPLASRETKILLKDVYDHVIFHGCILSEKRLVFMI